MGAAISSSTTEDHNNGGSVPGLDDIPESCISSLLMNFDPPDICKLATVNRAFYRASSADFLWESKLPSSYKFLVDKVLAQENLHNLSKKQIYAKLCRPNRFDGGTKEAWLDKCSGQVCFLMSSKSLKITGIDDRRYWNFIPTEESRFQNIAYLQQMWWVEVLGENSSLLLCGSVRSASRYRPYILSNLPFWIRLLFSRSIHPLVKQRKAVIIGNMSEVENKVDFIQWLEPDMSFMIISQLDDPCDLVRVSTVSSSWHRFVIENGLCKQLCLKMFPEFSGVVHVVEEENMIEPVSDTISNAQDFECLKRNHKVYAFLAHGLPKFMTKDCISEAISASSTDNYPEESIQNTLDPRDITEHRASYWSSQGESDPSVPETLVYKLAATICVVTEINVRPFQAYFQHGFPIYSASAVRFRMGHPRYPVELESPVADITSAHSEFGDNDYIWTYISPEFPMAHENRLQKFKLPEPVLCIGGVLLVELLGRVQKQEMDQLFYICISHVQVVGRPLSPDFDVTMHHPLGKCTLKYCPQTDCCSSSTSSSGDSIQHSRLRAFTAGIMQRGVRRWEQMILAALLGSGTGVIDDNEQNE
ncbi:hypothetical protein L6164_008317 [Bauhinia variegata]|uniref:Uncharacterized protein n=1 Tax=Bauhinia variegata TaxID=167791 RepID=A0ACB9PHI3_BAUVA|nr:hypothetical protein L6164_008317 [Bauhinia variegata]